MVYRWGIHKHVWYDLNHPWHVFAVFQALLVPDFKSLKMPAFKDLLVLATVVVISGLTWCQNLPSKFKQSTATTLNVDLNPPKNKMPLAVHVFLVLI